MSRPNKIPDHNILISAILAAQGFTSPLDQYQIEEQIGEGSCNPVWKGVHKVSGIRVAIKAMDTKKGMGMERGPPPVTGETARCWLGGGDHLLHY